MDSYIALALVPAVFNLGLGMYVWNRNPEARENRLLAIGCVGLGVYCFRIFEVYSRPPESAEFLFPLLAFGPLFAGAALSDFLLNLSGHPLLRPRWLAILIIYAPVTFFSLGEATTNWFFAGFEVTDTGQMVPLSGPLVKLENYFLLILVLLALLVSVATLFTRAESRRKKQLLWSLTGMGISLIFTFFVLDIDTFPRLPPQILVLNTAFCTTLIASTMVYAIVRHGMAPSLDELRRREEQLRREKAEALARESELQRQILDAQVREEHRRQEELEGELRMARDLQMGLMPGKSPLLEGFEVAGRCLPATHVGGDYFQYFVRDNSLTIAVADVAGHAMQAAIPVVMFSGILESQMELDSPVDQLFDHLNRSLCRVLDRRTYVCFAFGRLDLATRVVRLSNAGLPYPYHYRAASGDVVELQINAYPLGVQLQTAHQTVELPLEPGDRLVFCSDGIPEARSPSGEMYGDARTAALIRQGCQQGLPAHALLEHIVDTVRTFAGDHPPDDDMTCVVLNANTAS